MYDKSIHLSNHSHKNYGEEHEAESTFLKDKEFCFCYFQAPTSELNTFDSDFNCTTRKSTLTHTTVFLLQVMHFAKLNKPPSLLSPPLKCLKK